MESVTINRKDELFIWVYYRSQADTAAEADDLKVISKEAVRNSWGILSPILGHKYHQNHPDTNLQLKSESDHIFIFPCAIALLTLIILDLVSEERRERFRHLS